MDRGTTTVILKYFIMLNLLIILENVLKEFFSHDPEKHLVKNTQRKRYIWDFVDCYILQN